MAIVTRDSGESRRALRKCTSRDGDGDGKACVCPGAKFLACRMSLRLADDLARGSVAGQGLMAGLKRR